MHTVPALNIDMNYCRRCGSAFVQQNKHVFTCANNHVIYANASPATAAIIVNPANEVLVIKRAIEPGKGKLDLPGGFCDGAEALEDATKRELTEEVGITPDMYGELEYVCSGIDNYSLSGEVLPVCSVIYQVTLNLPVVPKPDDDAAEAFFVPLTAVKPEEFYFPALQKALAIIKRQQS